MARNHGDIESSGFVENSNSDRYFPALEKFHIGLKTVPKVLSHDNAIQNSRKSAFIDSSRVSVLQSQKRDDFKMNRFQTLSNQRINPAFFERRSFSFVAD